MTINVSTSTSTSANGGQWVLGAMPNSNQLIWVGPTPPPRADNGAVWIRTDEPMSDPKIEAIPNLYSPGATDEEINKAIESIRRTADERRNREQ